MRMSASSTVPMNLHRTKKVWIWTECKEVMTTAVERGWNTFVFSSDNLQLSKDWSCTLQNHKQTIRKKSFLSRF